MQRTMTNTIDAPSRQSLCRAGLAPWLGCTFDRGRPSRNVVVNAHPGRSGIGVSIVNLKVAFGPEAVILFFVLSGFVLSLPAVNGRPQTYPTFITRRIFRIYVPYLAGSNCCRRRVLASTEAFLEAGGSTDSGPSASTGIWSGSTFCSWESTTPTSSIYPYGRWSTRCASLSSSLCCAGLFCSLRAGGPL